MLLFPILTFGQEKFLKGYQYAINENKVYPFDYLRTFSKMDSLFVTIYNIYDPKSERLSYVITAINDPSKKTIYVEVNVHNGPHLTSEEVGYDTPSLNPFGYRGISDALVGKYIPDQLKVKFVSSNFENVKIMEVSGTIKGTTGFMFFVLDK